MQGVTELHEVERCKDLWLRGVQDEFRHGRLSEDNRNFLHGAPTAVPDSWVEGDVLCGRDACRALVEAEAASRASADASNETARKRPRRKKTFRGRVLSHECAQCKAERESKARVALTPADERFASDKFAKAPAIFAHNDVKYDTNKNRSRLFAARRNAAVVYSVARDTPSQDALRERPGLAADKVKWLQRHDRECGDLYGMLPLIHNMPVALTDHIDRSPDKQLLRGRIGHVHSWVLHKDEDTKVEDGVQRLTTCY